ncbi:hypothetical protein F5B20DRAFT_563922 [Whalleya microplaca]|nr:hypothetical protein F5B20DRAFT_563922 [Whalleya microplaca]
MRLITLHVSATFLATLTMGAALALDNSPRGLVKRAPKPQGGEGECSGFFNSSMPSLKGIRTCNRHPMSSHIYLRSSQTSHHSIDTVFTDLISCDKFQFAGVILAFLPAVRMPVVLIKETVSVVILFVGVLHYVNKSGTGSCHLVLNGNHWLMNNEGRSYNL